MTFRRKLQLLIIANSNSCVINAFLQFAFFPSSTMSNINDPYPMLVMVGPEGSGNKELAMKLAEEFSENFGYG